MQNFYRKNKTLLVSSIFVLLFVCVVITQILYDRAANPFSFKMAVVKRNLLPASILPYISLGFNNVLADYYWIYAIQDLTVWDHKDSRYIEYFRNISTLDPTFEYPYLFSIFTIPRKDTPALLQKLTPIADKGIAAIPTSWQIPFYLSTAYNITTKSYNDTEHYLSIAASKSSGPPGIYLVYSSFITKKLKGKEAAREMIKVIYDNTDNEIIKQLAAQGIVIDDATQMLEKAVIAYKAKYGSYPKTVDDMSRLNLIHLPDAFTNAFTIDINKYTGAVKVEVKNP
jgi:hypothetical protein